MPDFKIEFRNGVYFFCRFVALDVVIMSDFILKNGEF